MLKWREPPAPPPPGYSVIRRAYDHDVVTDWHMVLIRRPLQAPLPKVPEASGREVMEASPLAPPGSP